MDKFNFEDYRQPWETGPHWELKREFIEKYSDMFPEDRLLCLAQAYSNVVLMNCSYPDPVMRQISLLSKPLEMRKKFQEMNNSTDAETPKSQKQGVTEKRKSIYENSGRPFKQIKFCASKEQISFSSHPSVSCENTSEQSESLCTLASNSRDTSQQLSTTMSSYIDENQVNAIVSDSDSKGNILQQTKEEEKIIQTLGLEFIQNFVQVIRNCQVKCNSAVESILQASQKLKIQNKIHFDISEAPNSLPRVPVFSSKFSIDNCVISTETGFNKKTAKLKSGETAVDVLIKLSNSCVSANNSFGLNAALTITKNDEINIEKNISDNMSVLQMFSKKIVNRTKEQNAVFALKNITKSLNMLNYIAFDVISDSKSPQDSQYICKFFIKNILISSGRHTFINHAKELAVESAFIKLENLSKYEIQNGELVEQQSVYNSNNKSFELTSKSSIKHTNIETQDIVKTPFILNKYLFNSSMRDSFMLLDNLSLKPLPQRNLRTLLVESALFCHKPFEYRFEDIPGSDPPSKKAYAVLEEEIIGTGIAYSKDAAKILACEKAVEMLRKKYYSLKMKNEYIDGYIISRNQVFEGESFSSGALTESNIGCKMLKSMGWTGGGLGTSGISEPVEAQGHHSFGSGLGYGIGKGDLQLFRRRIESMLQDYKNTNTLSSLVFSKEFSKDERKEIHKISLKYHLHSVSYGTNENRFLTVRHKYTATQVLHYLANNGGSSSKFELIDASETPFTL